MHRSRFISVLLALATTVVCVEARADLSATVMPGVSAPMNAGVEASRLQYQASRFTSHLHVDAAGAIDFVDLATGEFDGQETQTAPTSDVITQQVPDVPGSASLFLSAMASLGAWHLVRSARQINLMQLPEWYHTGAPAQIGNSYAFDLQPTSPCVCFFEQPSEGRPFFVRIPRELRVRCGPDPYLPTADPRGPPA